MYCSHKPVSSFQVIAELNRAAVQSTLDPDIAWTLRLLAYQHYRPDQKIAEWADQELVNLYSADFNEEVPEAETELSDYSPTGAREDRTPPDYPAFRRRIQAVVCRPDFQDTVREPLALACLPGEGDNAKSLTS